MANNQINLQIITPTRVVFDEWVDSVVLRTNEGDMGVWYDHEPVVALLAYGILRYKKDNKDHKATIMSGFAEVTEDKVVIMTDSSELEHEVDVERARAAKARAEGRLSKEEFDTKRAQIALRKALVRLNAGEGK